jgi:uncharacterized membrane protein
MILEFIFRWAHVLFGIVWIGMLYYFNFVQTEYFKEAEADAKADAVKKLAPRALWWFRWGAMGALAGTLMFLNVWLIIWPKQQVVLGLKEGDGPSSAAKAGLASRTNTLFSGPMLFGMLGSKHLFIADVGATGFWACVIIILALEANALFGKTGPMTSVKGVIHCSLGLTALLWVLLALL